jgi:hypothetical protein
MKLDVWEQSLDEVNQRAFRMKQKKKGEKMSFNEEFAQMKAKMSRFSDMNARTKWEEVFLFCQGKITIREWGEFEINFKSAMEDVKPTPSEEEARRVLVSKVPQFVLKWITEEEERKMTTNPMVIMNAPSPEVNEGGSQQVWKF